MRGLLLPAVGISVACGSSSNATSSPGSAEVDSGNTGPVPRSIDFVPPDTVQLTPSETHLCHFEVEPPSSYDVNLALLDHTAEQSLDASLNQSVVQTEADGTGSFVVTASSKASSFDVRANIAQVSTVLSISVSDNGFATVVINGSYSGQRNISQWVATLYSAHTCADLGTDLPDDGSNKVDGTGLSPTQPPKLEMSGVPAGQPQSTFPQAIILRGDHLVWGCRDIPPINSLDRLELQVSVYDVPLSYGVEPVGVTFDVTTNATEWASALSTVELSILVAFVQSSDNDATLLLDTMRDSLTDPTEQANFETRRVAGGWDSALVSDWNQVSTSAETLIRDRVQQWLDSGAQSVSSGTSIATNVSLSAGQLTLLSWQELEASAWTSSPQVPLSVTNDANDAISATTFFSFRDGSLLRLLAQASALTEYPNTANLPDALASWVNCAAMGVHLANLASVNGACDSTCLAELCQTALSMLWDNTATEVKKRDNSQLSLNCSGKLRLNSNALVTGYDGSWVGMISPPAPAATVTTGGTLH